MRDAARGVSPITDAIRDPEQAHNFGVLAWMRAIRDRTDIGGEVKGVALALGLRFNKDTGRAHPGHALLSRDSGWSRSTVKRCLRALLDLGLIAEVSRGDGKMASVYVPSMSGGGHTEPGPDRTRSPQNPEGVHTEPAGGSDRPPDSKGTPKETPNKGGAPSDGKPSSRSRRPAGKSSRNLVAQAMADPDCREAVRLVADAIKAAGAEVPGRTSDDRGEWYPTACLQAFHALKGDVTPARIGEAAAWAFSPEVRKYQSKQAERVVGPFGWPALVALCAASQAHPQRGSTRQPATLDGPGEAVLRP